MKKVFMIILMAAAICLVACGNANKSDGKEVTSEKEVVKSNNDEVPTGYPEGEAQRMFVMYEDTLYVYDDNGYTEMEEDSIKDEYEGFDYVAKVSEVTVNVPNDNLQASRIAVGSSIYTKENVDNILVYYNGAVYNMIRYE